MRVEVSKEVASVLDEIRRTEWSIQGKGHSDTIRFLARYYQKHKALEKTVEHILQLYGVNSWIKYQE